ncbi:MAG: hypothetical protein U1E41_09435 [Paracoccus sp. (in: a-proteobacteria)]
MENTQRNRDHYSGAAWLSYDLNRMPEVQRKAFLFDLVASAKSGNAKARNILIDPRLLAADRDDPSVNSIQIARTTRSRTLPNLCITIASIAGQEPAPVTRPSQPYPHHTRGHQRRRHGSV